MTDKIDDEFLFLRSTPVGKYVVRLDYDSGGKDIRTFKLVNKEFRTMETFSSHLKKSSEKEFEIDMAEWKPGKYFVVLEAGNEKRIVKLVRRPDLDIRNRN